MTGPTVRRVLHLAASAAAGAGLIILFSTGEGAPFGIGLAVFLVLVSLLGTRWGKGPLARGVRFPGMALAGALGVPLLGLAALLVLWRPGAFEPLPLLPALACFAVAGLLFIPIGLMGADPD